MGILLGIARAPAGRAALIEIEEAQVGGAEGIQGDARGRNPGRQVTVLFREGWESACGELGVTLHGLAEEIGETLCTRPHWTPLRDGVAAAKSAP